MTPCAPEVEVLAVELATALSEAQELATRIGMPLAPVEPPALIVGTSGQRVGLNLDAPSCTSSVGPAEVDDDPSRDLGIAQTVVLRGQDALEIRSLAATELDREAWLSVVVHEWLHLQHGLAHDREWFSYRQRPLERRFLRDEAHRERVIAAIRAGLDAVADCDRMSELNRAWTEHQVSMSPRLTSFWDRWTTTEGLARYTELWWEQTARGEEPTELSVAKACAVVDDGAYGYALGCTTSAALAACAGEGWREQVLRDSLGAALAPW